MRFASLQSNNVSDYASAGKQVADSAVKSFAIQWKYGPDYAGLSKVAMAAQTAEEIAANEAQSKFAKASINAVSNVKRTQIKTDAGLEVNKYDIKSRKAGILPAIGKIAGSGFKKDPKRPPPVQRVAPVLAEYPEYPTVDYSDRPQAPQHSTFSPSATSDVESTGTPLADGTPRSTPTSNGTALTQAQGTQLLVDQGMPLDQARIGGAVMMAESSGRPSARSSAELEAQTGERSLGLWQHNMNSGEDRRAFYGIQDESELNDPATNARATYRLWERAGGQWTDWGAYTNGSYKKFL